MIYRVLANQVVRSVECFSRQLGKHDEMVTSR